MLWHQDSSVGLPTEQLVVRGTGASQAPSHSHRQLLKPWPGPSCHLEICIYDLRQKKLPCADWGERQVWDQGHQRSKQNKSERNHKRKWWICGWKLQDTRNPPRVLRFKIPRDIQKLPPTHDFLATLGWHQQPPLLTSWATEWGEINCLCLSPNW